MPNLLHLDSSADLTGSRSRAITAAFEQAWTARGPEYTVTRRDLHLDPLPHLSTPALHWAPRLRVEGETAPAADEARQQVVLDELLAADVLLIGAPMYNYSLPSTLKVWIDYIHVMGVTTTFDETPSQPLAGRPAIVATSSGGSYTEGKPTAGWDHATPVLELILGTALGMSVTVLNAELTLAPRIPELHEFIPHSESVFEKALASATELGASLLAL
jgi:FMN-dependent NADH-azoreductase